MKQAPESKHPVLILSPEVGLPPEKRHLSQVTLRPGDAFGKWIEARATEWVLSRGETVKRLAIMSATGFSPAFYPALAEMAEGRGGREAFACVCRNLRRVFVEKAEQIGRDLSHRDELTIVEGTLRATRKGEDVKVSLEPVVGSS